MDPAKRRLFEMYAGEATLDTHVEFTPCVDLPEPKSKILQQIELHDEYINQLKFKYQIRQPNSSQQIYNEKMSDNTYVESNSKNFEDLFDLKTPQAPKIPVDQNKSKLLKSQQKQPIVSQDDLDPKELLEF